MGGKLDVVIGLLGFAAFIDCFALTRSYYDNIYNDPGAQYVDDVDAAVSEAKKQLYNGVTYADYRAADQEVFDFIVVGAGSAGSVVANRLSENPNWRVLLLEAGGDPTVTSQMPGLADASFNTTLDWKYVTEPQPNNCLGSENKRCFWPRGKVLGGSTVLNGMLYVRGNPVDFDGWENMGNPGWGYTEMLRYFKKSEDLRSEPVLNENNSKYYHGTGGYLPIESYGDNQTYLTDIFSQAFAELGYKTFVDVNADQHEGLFSVQGTLKNSRRSSTAFAFLLNFQNRPNLVISKQSLVTKILIDRFKTAYGVEYAKGRNILTAIARKEVIVSGGTVNSPQLLMLSGIGPRKHLLSHNIQVKQDLKVGLNLQDHSLMRGFLISLDYFPEPVDQMQSTFDFLINSRGAYAGVGLLSTIGFIRTLNSPNPNIEIYFTGFPPNSTESMRYSLTVLGLKREIIESIIKINLNKYTLFLMPSLLSPRSRGSIKLKSRNPFDHPLIYPDYFSDDGDMEDVLAGVEFGNRFVNSEAMRILNSKVEQINIDGCDSFEFQTEAYWRCVIKHMTVTVFHPAGTCKMGPATSEDSVVDSQLRVIGINHLRVVDASIMPNVTRGNTNAPTIAIAEKASDLIKASWNGKFW